MLTFDELRFFIMLIVAVDFVLIVHIVNFEKKLRKYEIALFFLPFAIIMFNLFAFINIGDWTVNSSTALFITSIQSSVVFAFFFSVVSFFLLVWYYLNPSVKQFLPGSLLISQLALLLLILSYATGLISPGIIPAAIQDYIPLVVVTVVGVVFKIIEGKGTK